MFRIGYKAVGTFLEDGYPAINCLRLFEDVEKHGNLTGKQWRRRTLERVNLKRFCIAYCDDTCALLYTCHDGIPRLVEHVEKDLDPVQLQRHAYEHMWKVKVKCQNYDMPINIPCANETSCFVYLEALATQLEREKLVIYDLHA